MPLPYNSFRNTASVILPGEYLAPDLAADMAFDLADDITADIAAVGPYGRGYRRVKFVFDTSEGVPIILHRQDRTHLGWALGKDTRTDLLALAKEATR